MKRKSLFFFNLLVLSTLSGCNSSKTTINVFLPNGENASKDINIRLYEGNNLDYKIITTNNKGVATIELDDKEYIAYIDSKDYAMKPLIIKDSKTYNANLEIINTYSSGEGDAYNPYIIKEGVYNIIVNDNITYYGFRPNRPGKYLIESWATPELDPKIGFYGNNDAFVNEFPIQGMEDDDSGMNSNFSIELSIPKNEFINTGEYNENGELIYQKDEDGNLVAGGNYKLGISLKGNTTTGQFPISIKWIEDYDVEYIPAEIMEVSETLTLYPNNESTEIIYKEASLNGTVKAVYNENDRFYHVNEETGPVLVAKITQPCLYLEEPFTEIELAGNKALTVDNGTKNYSSFIKEYGEYCNSDGVYGVTEELKIFLEYYYLNASQWIESISETIVDPDCGWMFACGYYISIDESYEKPWSGSGTIDEPYAIYDNEYYAKVKENQTLYYQYSIRGEDEINGVTILIETTNPNAKIIYNELEYNATSEGLVLEIELGKGKANSILFGITTIDGTEEGIVFSLRKKEQTVEGNAISLGTNTVEVLKYGIVECEYNVTKKGTYVFFCDEANAYVEDENGNEYISENGVITFSKDLNVGDVLKFNIATQDFERDYITFTLNMSAKLGRNTVEIGANEEINYPFVANEAGTYEIACGTSNTWLSIETSTTTEIISDQGAKMTVTLAKGEEISILVSTNNMRADTVVFIITKK